MFTTALSYFHPTKERYIFLHDMEIIKIIIRKEIWRIIRRGQITNIISIENIEGSWEHICGIMGSFMQEGSITNGDGRYIQIWDTKFKCKGVIEAVIKSPVVVLQC